MPVLRVICSFIAAFFRDRLDLAAENIALRQQLAVLQLHARCAAVPERPAFASPDASSLPKLLLIGAQGSSGTWMTLKPH